MSARSVCVVLVLACWPRPATAEPQRRLGIVTSIGEDSIEITTSNGSEESIRTDRTTSYVKWVTHPPWQQRTVADRSVVKLGRCVAIELRAGDSAVAALVRINDDPIGSLGSPCRERGAKRK
jgi:hypothetical protein